MVENVEKLGSELVAERLSDLAVLEEGEIPVLDAGSPDRVPPRVAKRSLGGVDEATGIEPF
jgi:hypothetical protein